MAKARTPEEKLCSWWWRFLNSAWLLQSILSFGLLTPIGFLVHGIKARKLYWTLSGLGWLLVSITTVVLLSVVESGTKEDPVDSPASTASGFFLIFTWIGGVIHAISTNKEWLAWKAHNGKDNGNSQPSKLISANQASENSAEVFSENPPKRVDINTGTASDFENLGVDVVTAKAIVERRDKSGGFRDLDDLMTTGGLAPHLFAQINESLTIQRPNRTGPPRQSGGRKLEL